MQIDLDVKFNNIYYGQMMVVVYKNVLTSCCVMSINITRGLITSLQLHHVHRVYLDGKIT